MRVRQIKILYIFVPNLGEIYLLVKKSNSFFSKTEAHLATWQTFQKEKRRSSLL